MSSQVSVLRDMAFFKQFIVAIEDTGYVQRIRLRFPNGYGASLILGSPVAHLSGNILELAVVRYNRDGSFLLDYDTSLGPDVLRLVPNEVEGVLREIFSLPVVANLKLEVE